MHPVKNGGITQGTGIKLETAAARLFWHNRERVSLNEEIEAQTRRFHERSRDKLIVERTLIGRCEYRKNCDAKELDGDEVVDSLLMATPMSINYAESAIADARSSIEEAQAELDRIQRSRELPLQRLRRYLAMPINCQEILYSDDIERVSHLIE
jgi:hypothetical protein